MKSWTSFCGPSVFREFAARCGTGITMLLSREIRRPPQSRLTPSITTLGYVLQFRPDPPSVTHGLVRIAFSTQRQPAARFHDAGGGGTWPERTAGGGNAA